MGIKVEFNIRISDKLAREIDTEKATLGIKVFEYSAEYGYIEFNDNVTGPQALNRMANLKDRFIRLYVPDPNPPQSG